MNNNDSILGYLLLASIFLWVFVTSLYRIRDIVETQTVSDSGGASLDREDYPVWFWFRLTGVAGGLLAVSCVLIAILLKLFLGLFL